MSDTDTDDAEILEGDGDAPPPRTNSMVRRGFDGVTSIGQNAATQALTAKATADAIARWQMAMNCPRDLDEVRQRIMHECKRPKFAEVAVYEVPRGTSKITGLSIRFAEVAMRCMGNMGCEAQTIFDSTEERVIRISATDYETNASWQRDITIKKTVERKRLAPGQRAIRERINSYGDRVFIVEGTDEDIATKEAAEISKKSRTAILRLIPGHLQDEALKLCNKVYQDKAAKDPDAEKNAVLDAFAEQNVFPSDLADWLGHSFDQVTPAQLGDLRRLFVALREGQVSWPEALDQQKARREKAKKEPAAQAAPTKEAAASSKPAAAPAPAATPAAAPAPAPAPAAEQRTSSGKGTAAAKERVGRNQQAAPAEPPKEEAKEEPNPNSAVPEMDLRDCFGCAGPIEVPKDAPPRQMCEACRQM